MESLKVIRFLVFGIIFLGITALIASALFPVDNSPAVPAPDPAGSGGFNWAALIVGLALVFGLSAAIAIMHRSANSPTPPKYSDSELKVRVRDALRSKSRKFVLEVLSEVAMQWGDGKEYHKLSAKLTALSGRRIAPEIPDAGGWDESTLKRLYPDVYGKEESELDDYE